MIAETTIGALRALAHAGRSAILFLTSVGSPVTLFEASGIAPMMDWTDSPEKRSIIST
jgi:hypothetical protein